MLRRSISLAVLALAAVASTGAAAELSPDAAAGNRSVVVSLRWASQPESDGFSLNLMPGLAIGIELQQRAAVPVEALPSTVVPVAWEQLLPAPHPASPLATWNEKNSDKDCTFSVLFPNCCGNLSASAGCQTCNSSNGQPTACQQECAKTKAPGVLAASRTTCEPQLAEARLPVVSGGSVCELPSSFSVQPFQFSMIAVGSSSSECNAAGCVTGTCQASGAAQQAFSTTCQTGTCACQTASGDCACQISKPNTTCGAAGAICLKGDCQGGQCETGPTITFDWTVAEPTAAIATACQSCLVSGGCSLAGTACSATQCSIAKTACACGDKCACSEKCACGDKCQCGKTPADELTALRQENAELATQVHLAKLKEQHFHELLELRVANAQLAAQQEALEVRMELIGDLFEIAEAKVRLEAQLEAVHEREALREKLAELQSQVRELTARTPTATRR